MAKPKFVYIVSPRYSGSTLLSYLFGCHPDVATIGERKKFWVKAVRGPLMGEKKESNTCSCGEAFSSCPYWQELLKKLKGKVPPESLRLDFSQFKLFASRKLNYIVCRSLEEAIVRRLPLRTIPGCRRMMRMCETNSALVDTVLEMDGKSVFIDSSKPVRYALMLSLIDKFDVHIVHLFREPLAQVSSALKYNDWTPVGAAQRLKAEWSHTESLLSRSGISRVCIAYERLCAEPELTMNRIFDFLGMPRCEQFSLRSQSQHIMGNANMRLGGEQKIEIRTDWVDRLSSEAVLAVQQVCGDMWAEIQSRQLDASPAQCLK